MQSMRMAQDQDSILLQGPCMSPTSRRCSRRRSSPPQSGRARHPNSPGVPSLPLLQGSVTNWLDEHEDGLARLFNKIKPKSKHEPASVAANADGWRQNHVFIITARRASVRLRRTWRLGLGLLRVDVAGAHARVWVRPRARQQRMRLWLLIRHLQCGSHAARKHAMRTVAGIQINH